MVKMLEERHEISAQKHLNISYVFSEALFPADFKDRRKRRRERGRKKKQTAKQQNLKDRQTHRQGERVGV